MPGYSFADFWFDTDRDEVARAGQAIKLTLGETKFLRLLLEAGKALTEYEIREAMWDQDTTVDVSRSLAVLKSIVNKKLGKNVIGRAPNGKHFVICPIIERERLDMPFADTDSDIASFLSETRYGISPVGEYLPVYPVYVGLSKNEIGVKYNGDYEPPDDFRALMKRFPPEPPVNELYSFNGWEGEIPSEDELAGEAGKKVVFHLKGGTWHHVHTLTQIRKASTSTPADAGCVEFRRNHLKKLIPLSASDLYHNVNAEVIVVTADEQIVIARRKGAIVFAGNWTASLEEQMLRFRQKDGLTDDADLFACAERGAHGELGITVISDETKLLSVGIEFGNFTAAFLMLIRSAETFAEIATKTWPNASECDEAVALDRLPAQPEAILAALKTDQYAPNPETSVVSPRWNSSSSPRTPGQWHPVAKARLDAYLRHLATINARRASQTRRQTKNAKA